jgi:alpha-methylacyl-CoA racemase
VAPGRLSKIWISCAKSPLSSLSLLNGFVVVDLSLRLPGARTAQLLRELGAHVIKWIPTPQGDPTEALDGGFAFEDLNHGKELIRADLNTEEGRQQFAQVLSRADALVENHRPELQARWRIAPKTLLSQFPSLCILSLQGFPETDPRSTQPFHDLNLMAESGIASLFGEMPPLPLAHFFGSSQAATTLLAMLLRRQKTGQGGHETVSLFDCLTRAQRGMAQQYSKTHTLPRPQETLYSGKYPCYRIYRAACGQRLALGALERKYWQIFCSKLGLEDLVDQGLAVGEEGKRTIQKVEERLLQKTWAEWSKDFLTANCCFTPVKDYRDLFDGQKNE